MGNVEYKKSIDKLLNVLKRKGWNVVRKDVERLSLDGDFCNRYPKLPEDFAYFLATVELCRDSTGGMWFLTEAEYNRQRENPLIGTFARSWS
jgi:hypothetical protein